MMRFMIVQLSASGFKDLVGTDGAVSPAERLKQTNKFAILT